MTNTKFKSIPNKAKFIEEFKKQTFPQLEDKLVLAIELLIEKDLIINKNGTINSVGQNALKCAIDLNNGADPIKIAKQLKGAAHKNVTQNDITNSFAILGILAYFVKGGPKVFKTYLKHNKATFPKDNIEDIERYEGRHKIYEAEMNVEKVRKEESKKFR